MSAGDGLDATPLGNEQGDRPRDPLERGQAHSLVEAMDVVRNGSVHKAWYALVDHEHATIEVSGSHEQLQRGAVGGDVRLRQGDFGVGPLLQYVSLREEAVPFDRWRRIGQVGVAACGGHHGVLDLPCRLGCGNAGVDGDPAVDGAPGRHGRGPVAARDLADIEVDGVVERFEVAVLALEIVPALFEVAQRADDGICRLDGVGAQTRIAHVDGLAGDRDPEPQHAGVGAHQLVVLGLGNDGCVRRVAARHGRRARRCRCTPPR